MKKATEEVKSGELVAPEQSAALAKAESQAMQGTSQRPDFAEGADDSTAHIGREDIKMPRICIAQGLSPQIVEGGPKYIEGLTQGRLFNDLTRQIYGKGPIDFVVVASAPPRWIEFRPREDGGGVVDMDVQPGDERTKFRKDNNGKSIPPIATMFYDYVILLLPTLEPVALSLKSTGLKAARTLNGLIKLRNAPLYAGRYTLGVGMETNTKGTYGVFTIDNSKVVDAQASMPGWPSKDVYDQAKAAYLSLKGKVINVEREADDPATDFDPTTMGE
jgi:hypothetical protein